jgi:hypothetical protein
MSGVAGRRQGGVRCLVAEAATTNGNRNENDMLIGDQRNLRKGGKIFF